MLGPGRDPWDDGGPKKKSTPLTAFFLGEYLLGILTFFLVG